MRSREFDERDRAVLDALLKQYEFIRTEIIQSIYLKHAAIIGLYSFLGAIIVILTGGVTKENSSSVLGSMLEFRFFDSADLNLDKTIFFLFILIFVQIIVCGFGSLYLKEQARNRRACSFQKAIEHLINEKIGEIGVYWENYITSELIAKEKEGIDYFKFNIPVNPEYYKNRFLGVGLPVFLPNILITSLIGFILYVFCRENLFFLILPIIFIAFAVKTFLSIRSSNFLPGILITSLIGIALWVFFRKSIIFASALFAVSLVITYFWAWMILNRSRFSLKEEKMPSGRDVFRWLKQEQSKILLKGVSSTFTLKGGEVEMEVHVVTDGISEKIWDIEIFPEDQDPRWESVKGIEASECWNIKNKDNRVRFYTDVKPLKECESAKFEFTFQFKRNIAHNTIYFIKVHLTDKNQKNIGEMISWPGIASTFTPKDNIIEMEVHVMGDELDRKIYDIEIKPKDQRPHWEKVECIEDEDAKLPEGWGCKKINNKTDKGVRFFTKTKPLKKCKPARFKFKARIQETSRYIKLNLTDKDGKALREVIALKN